MIFVSLAGYGDPARLKRFVQPDVVALGAPARAWAVEGRRVAWLLEGPIACAPAPWPLPTVCASQAL